MGLLAVLRRPGFRPSRLARLLSSSSSTGNPPPPTSLPGEPQSLPLAAAPPCNKPLGIDGPLMRSVGILTASQFVGNLGFGCVLPVLPVFATDIGLGASGVGLIMSSSALSRLALNVPFGRLLDHDGGVPRKPLMVSGQLIIAAASFGTALSTTLPVLIGWRLLLGAGQSCSSSGTGTYLADLTKDRLHIRGKVLGFNSTVISSSYAFGPAVGGWLCDLYGARPAFFIVGAASLVTSMGYMALTETVARKKPFWPAFLPWSEAEGSSKVARRKVWERGGGFSIATFAPLLRDPNQQAALAQNFAMFSSYAVLLTVFPLHASECLSSTAEVGTLFAMCTACSTFGSPIGGWLCDRIGRKATVVPASLVISSALVTMTLPWVDNFWSFVPILMAVGLGHSCFNPAVSAFSADTATSDETRGTILSLHRMAQDGAFLFMPVGLGVLAQFTSCSTALHAAAGIIGAANAVFALRAQETLSLGGAAVSQPAAAVGVEASEPRRRREPSRGAARSSSIR